MSVLIAHINLWSLFTFTSLLYLIILCLFFETIFIFRSDSDKIEIIFEDVYIHSKKEILKVIANLEIMYGANSDEKANGFNDLYKHLMNHLNVS